MSSVYQEIRNAFETNLVNVTGLPEVAWENIDFQPTTGTPFVAVQLIPISRQPAVRGLNPSQRYDILYRIDVLYPTGNGPAAAEAMADTILEAFDSTTDISGSTLTISITNSDRGQGTVDEPWYVIPLSINAYVYEV